MSSIGSTVTTQREQVKTKMDDSGFDSFKENNKKKNKNEHQKAGKIIQNQKYFNKKNVSQRIIRQGTGPHQLANGGWTKK